MISFSDFEQQTDAQCLTRISAARALLGSQAVLLSHHYQRANIHQYADITGDSLKLAKLAAKTDARYIIFCGVHFMAEVADILSRPEQIAILPDLAAGCSMADMANLSKVERCWNEIAEILDPESQITPVTYINSAANLKAFCGSHGGIVCTSSNAPSVVRWAFAQRPKILFFPDQHLGRWTGHCLGVAAEEMVVWNPDQVRGGLTEQQIDKAKIILWQGYCAVHQMFQKTHIERFRNQYPDGQVISHPECSFEVCAASDSVGSTEYIIKTIKEAPANTRWLVGTEFNLVKRLAKEVEPQQKEVLFMYPSISMCPTMQRIDPQHLAWVLENLAAGHVVNSVEVPAATAEPARAALQRMLDIS